MERAFGRAVLSGAHQTADTTAPANGSSRGLLVFPTRPSVAPLSIPMTGHTSWVTGVASVALPDGRVLLATTSYDGTVRLWDPATAAPVGEPLTGHTDAVSGVAAVALPDGRVLLATTSHDATVRLWDPATAAPVGEPADRPHQLGDRGGGGGVAGRAGPAGHHQPRRTVRLWDPATAAPVGEPLTGHTDSVTGVAAVALPDGRVLLATASGDGTVRLWDPATATPVGTP